MKALGFGAVVGAVLGVVVGVIAHFISHTLPSTYYVAFTTDGNRVDQKLASPLIHPSWWPTLPLCIVIGAVIGAVAFGALAKAGYALTRRPKATTED